MNSGIVARRFLGAVCIPGRSVYRSISGSRWSLIPLTNALRAQSYLHMYRSLFCKTSGQLERMWWIVGCFLPQSGHLESTFNHHNLKMSGVGNVSVPALRRKDNFPAGRPCVILLHTWFPS